MGPLQSVSRFFKVPLTIEAEFDREDLPLGELSQFRPGSVVRTTRSAADIVQLTVEGIEIGEGELISMENRLAVRVTSIKKVDRTPAK